MDGIGRPLLMAPGAFDLPSHADLASFAAGSGWVVGVVPLAVALLYAVVRGVGYAIGRRAERRLFRG